MLGVLEKASQNLGAVSFVRRSLVPNLLEAKRINEYRSNEDVELFEIAKVYLPQDSGIPRDPLLCSLVSSRDYSTVKGVLEMLARGVNSDLQLEAHPCDHDLLDVSQSALLKLNGETWGWLGRVSPWGRKLFGLRQDAVVAEFDLSLLEREAVLVPRHRQSLATSTSWSTTPYAGQRSKRPSASRPAICWSQFPIARPFATRVKMARAKNGCCFQ
jgi:phenylalanyl-tRNA synthetase beta chain